MSYGSLEEAMTLGYELERSYICAAHDDHNASASVNSVTGWYFCAACGHRGKVNESDLVLTPEGLKKFLERLEQIKGQIFPESWLNTFDVCGPGPYWSSRYSQDTCKHYRLGTAHDVATYPMRNNIGQVLGVVTRDLTGERKARYMYPQGVQVSQYLIDYHRVDTDTVMLCEGMSDVAAVYETGHQIALGCYKAGLSRKQADLIRKYSPKTILVGFDMDKAGHMAAQAVKDELGQEFHVKRLVWSDYNDLAAIPLAERTEMLNEIMATS